ncbi:hypothetical protein [Nocardia arthritidis]|uniref:Uncharacterized protein n=1 Tax=Nocardia arthritidis TaxID=228602 RepID=A0A6G9YMS7_9NOCA|nr:hypothetical protein [Nocardia arthritidis]QIS14514.1 hypothetical protein F5544_33390 [Nocardia arthritidis]
MTGPIEQATDPTQRTVALARATVSDGRGPDADPAEQARAQRNRDLLGALPAPLERELVARAAHLIRHSPGPILDQLRTEPEQLAAAWRVPVEQARIRLRDRW